MSSSAAAAAQLASAAAYAPIPQHTTASNNKGNKSKDSKKRKSPAASAAGDLPPVFITDCPVSRTVKAGGASEERWNNITRGLESLHMDEAQLQGLTMADAWRLCMRLRDVGLLLQWSHQDTHCNELRALIALFKELWPHKMQAISALKEVPVDKLAKPHLAAALCEVPCPAVPGCFNLKLERGNMAGVSSNSHIVAWVNENNVQSGAAKIPANFIGKALLDLVKCGRVFSDDEFDSLLDAFPKDGLVVPHGVIDILRNIYHSAGMCAVIMHVFEYNFALDVQCCKELCDEQQPVLESGGAASPSSVRTDASSPDNEVSGFVSPPLSPTSSESVGSFASTEPDEHNAKKFKFAPVSFSAALPEDAATANSPLASSECFRLLELASPAPPTRVSPPLSPFDDPFPMDLQHGVEPPKDATDLAQLKLLALGDALMDEEDPELSLLTSQHLMSSYSRLFSLASPPLPDHIPEYLHQ